MSPPIIAVLGSPNDAEGRLHSIALERCERASALARDNPEASLLLTGGFGDHFNTTCLPHAAYLKRHLVERGLPESRFLPFAESRSTLEDASLSKPIVLAHQGELLVVVTSDYHVARARVVFEREYSGTAVSLFFVATETDEDRCHLDLAALKAHELEALRRLTGPSPSG